jgi:hypothetical protein
MGASPTTTSRGDLGPRVRDEIVGGYLAAGYRGDPPEHVRAGEAVTSEVTLQGDTRYPDAGREGRTGHRMISEVSG